MKPPAFSPKIVLGVVLLAAFPALGPREARADIYRWTDANGVEHFVSSEDQVPPQYRKRTKTVRATPADPARIETRKKEVERYDRTLGDDAARDAALAAELEARRSERKGELQELRGELAEVEKALRNESFQANKNALRKRRGELKAEIAQAERNLVRPGVALPAPEEPEASAEAPAEEAPEAEDAAP